VERHLGECPGCQMFSSGLTESQGVLQEFHREPLAPAHFAAVRARVLAELERRRRPFWRRGWAFGFAAVAVALLVVVAPPVRSLLAPNPRPIPKSPVASSAGGLAAGVFVPPDSQGAPVTQGSPRIASHPRRARLKAQRGEPVLIRIVSDNPDVVIYWIAEARGD
jgi:hypothetical protein